MNAAVSTAIADAAYFCANGGPRGDRAVRRYDELLPKYADAEYDDGDDRRTVRAWASRTASDLQSCGAESYADRLDRILRDG